MRKDITLNVRLQPPDDLIDFPVSDVYRDHYAAQGLTSPSGRYGRVAGFKRNDPNGFIDGKQELDAARQEANGWKSTAGYWQGRCAKVEAELEVILQRLDSQRGRISEYKGVDLSACT
jgi:hypothetical protein